MGRRYEFMDLIVAVGLCATIVVSGLLFMAANGTQIRTVESGSTGQPTGNLAGMDWLQPVLGQAIVDHVLLERNHAKAAAAASTDLDGLTFERNRWQNSPYGYLDSITTGASWAEADHAARVQAVMGRSIVNFTRRGVRSGVWSSVERAAHHNPHMIDVTEAMGQKIDAGATVVATLTGLQKGRGESGGLTAHGGTDASTQDAWPGISTTTFLVASLILLSLFSAGLFVFPRGCRGFTRMIWFRWGPPHGCIPSRRRGRPPEFKMVRGVMGSTRGVLWLR